MIYSYIRHFILVSFVSVMLLGCSSMPLTSMIKMIRFDPLTADAKQIRVAIRLPDAIRVKNGGVVLAMSVERKKHSEEFEELFVLEPDSDTYGELESEYESGTHIQVFRIATQDLERIDSFRQQIITWLDQDPDDTPGAFSIQVSSCRIGESIPTGKLLVSTYLRTEVEDGFFPLVNDADLRFVETQGRQEQDSDTQVEQWLSRCPASS